LKVYISVDIEGISGFVNWDQYRAESAQHQEMRKLMTGEANAAIAGAFDGGATEVVVNDAHGSQRNLIPAEMDPRARLIFGNNKPLSMMQGIDESFDAAFFIGYHAGASIQGVCSHTYTGCVTSVALNGQPASEVVINAGVAGYFGVPVVLVSGDTVVCRDALTVLGPIETVAVKEPISRVAASCLHPEVARQRIRESAVRAMSRVGELEPFTLEPPVHLRISFAHTGNADRASLMPGVERLDSITVGYRGEDFINVYRAFLTLLVLADTAG